MEIPKFEEENIRFKFGTVIEKLYAELKPKIGKWTTLIIYHGLRKSIDAFEAEHENIKDEYKEFLSEVKA